MVEKKCIDNCQSIEADTYANYNKLIAVGTAHPVQDRRRLLKVLIPLQYLVPLHLMPQAFTQPGLDIFLRTSLTSLSLSILARCHNMTLETCSINRVPELTESNSLRSPIRLSRSLRSQARIPGPTPKQIALAHDTTMQLHRGFWGCPK